MMITSLIFILQYLFLIYLLNLAMCMHNKVIYIYIYNIVYKLHNFLFYKHVRIFFKYFPPTIADILSFMSDNYKKCIVVCVGLL